MPLRRLLHATFLALAALGPGGGAAAAAEPAYFASVIRLEAEMPADARTAGTLGTKRQGNGVVIDDSGLVLTIGYLVLEAMAVTVFDGDGRPVQAAVLAYDWDSGFGLVRAAGPLGVKPIALGDSDALKVKQPALVVGHGGADGSQGAYVVGRREFAGYWEYLLDDAIFTSPPHPHWAGAALVGPDGKLYGIGSLFVADALRGERILPGNMFVPINRLKPILADLLSDGRPRGPPKPWLGLYTGESHGKLVITRVAEDGPAARAGVAAGDVLVGVGREPVTSIADFYRKVWASGQAGVEVPLRLKRDDEPRTIAVKSIDRSRFLRLKPTY
jgi:S1-C subfamily serine protease